MPGCTISVILFALAMNMLVKTAEVEWKGPKPPIRAFMDDHSYKNICQNFLRKSISFVKAGEKPQPSWKAPSDILLKAADWHLKADLERQLKFPDPITTTTLQPYRIIFSDSTKQVIILELTVLWEECMEEANERKCSKYQELVEQCQSWGWRTPCEPIEMGCRGFSGWSILKAFNMLGIMGATMRKALRSVTEAAERATM